jgi:hypothetical protein
VKAETEILSGEGDPLIGHNSSLPRLTGRRLEVVRAGREALALARKSFEFWIAIGQALKELRDFADDLGGRSTFQQLRNREGYGEVSRARVSRLLTIIENLPAVNEWRGTLLRRQKFEWSSPESIYNRCPTLTALRGADKPKVKIAKPKGDERLREYSENDDESFCNAVDKANRKRLQVWVDELTSLNDVDFIESLIAEFRTAAYLALKRRGVRRRPSPAESAKFRSM